MNKRKTGLLRRFGAMAYDALLVLAILFFTTIPFVAMRGGEAVSADDNLAYRACLGMVVYAFFVGHWSLRGRTLGMQSWGLRVETPAGDLPTFTQATGRFLAAIVSLLPLGLGFFWQLVDQDRLTWHDRLSRTHLVQYPRPTLR